MNIEETLQAAIARSPNLPGAIPDMLALLDSLAADPRLPPVLSKIGVDRHFAAIALLMLAVEEE
jgi:hypothetical protein